MKRTFIIAVLSVLFTSIATAQELKDKMYFDKDWNVTTNAKDAAFYRLYNASDKSAGRKPYKDYYISGKLQGEGFIVWHDGEMIDDGPQKNYHENGKLHQTWTMKLGKMEGENYHYYENGNLKYMATYIDGKRNGKCNQYDSTGTLYRTYNYKNNSLDGKQTQYLSGELDLEDFFDNGVMQKEIIYSDGKIRRIFALVSRQDTTFIANDTWFLREDEDSLIWKRSVDKIYDFDPSIWEYPFQMHYAYLTDFTYDEEQNIASYGAISEQHGKFQTFDRQGRIIKDGQYSHDQKVGIWKYYVYNQNCYYTDDYDNKDEVTHYYTLDNKPFTGIFSQYENDGVKIVLNIKNGIRCGQYTAYHYDEGELIMKYFGNYDNAGQLDGYFHAEMSFDGEWKTVDFSNYKHSVKHGEWRTIANDSIIFKNYNNGELDGEYQIRIVNSREDYALPKDSLWHCITRGAYKNGLRTGHWWQITDSRFEQNQKEGDYIDGKAEGEWIFYGPYSPNGYLVMRQIDAIINFHNGMKEGKATTFKDKSNAPFKDSVDIIAYFKNDELDGSYEKHDNDGNIIEKGNNANGKRIGEWTFTYYDENCYKVINYDNKPTTAWFYTLNGKTFSGTHSEPYEKEYDDDPDTLVFTIKKSYIQQVEFIDSETGKVIQTSKFKNGLPKEE